MATRTTSNTPVTASAPYWALDAINFTFHDDDDGIAGAARWVMTQKVGDEYIKDLTTITVVPCLVPSGNTLIAPNPEDGTEVRLALNFEDDHPFYQWVQESYNELSAMSESELQTTKNGNRQELSDEWIGVPGWSIKVVRTVIPAKNGKPKRDFVNCLANLRRRPVTWSPRMR